MPEKREQLQVIERMKFTPEEGSLASRAILAFALSRLQLHEGNYPFRDTQTLLDDDGTWNQKQMQQTRDWLKSCQEFADKIQEGAMKSIDIEMYAEELILLNKALFSMGYGDAQNATKATQNKRIGFNTEEKRIENLRKIDQTVIKIKALFKRIEAVLKKNKLEWVQWE